MTLSGREKATIFLSILGAETSGRVLRYLPDELADLIAAGINHLPTPSPDALAEVMGEFKSYLALPEDESRTRQRLESRPQPSKPKRSYAILMYERPQMIAYLVSLLPEEEREDALFALPRDKAVVSELLAHLKENSLSQKLAVRLKEQFKGKIFA